MSKKSSLAFQVTSDEDMKQEWANLADYSDKYKDKVAMLPKEKAGWLAENLYKYQGFWFQSKHFLSVEHIMALEDNFKPKPTDIYLTGIQKSGTTWLRALTFAIVNRNHYKKHLLSAHPLLTTNPHRCVPDILADISRNKPPYPDSHSPRIYSTHIPYSLLPQSIHDQSECRLVYICRNPKDVLVSYFHFSNKLKNEGATDFNGHLTFEDAFELFSKGVSPQGPYWDNVIEYYNANLQQPQKVMFLTYEELKIDPVNTVKGLAKFLGCPFLEVEEGEVKEIIRMCSFEVLREVNKHGYHAKGTPNSAFFRGGKVGDWTNHLTPEMSRTLDQITKEKFHGLDISF